MINKKNIKKFLNNHDFIITNLSLVINPFYIIRRGLYLSISKYAKNINGIVLDFGCGTSPYKKLFVNATSYIGLDLKGQVSSHDRANFYYDGGVIPFADNSFDGIVSFEVIDDIFDPDFTVSELNRVLKSDGTLLITASFAWEEHAVPNDFARYTFFGLANLFERNGFELVDSVKTTTHFLAITQLFTAYLFLHCFPNSLVIKYLLQVLIIFPLNGLFLILDYFMPKSNSLYSSNTILFRKI